MSTMPPISSLGSAPLMVFNSPAAATPLIQSRKSLLAIATPHEFHRPAGPVVTNFCHRGNRVFLLLLTRAGTAFASSYAATPRVMTLPGTSLYAPWPAVSRSCDPREL